MPLLAGAMPPENRLTDDKYATNSRRAGGQARLAAAAPAESTMSLERRDDGDQRPEAHQPEHPHTVVDQLSREHRLVGPRRYSRPLVRRAFAQQLAASASPTAA